MLVAFGLADRRKAIATDLSGGQAKRLLIARALVHRPDVLFLDEPTAGLDPQTRVNLWDMLRELHAQGQTILLTTHYMEEAEALCDRVAVVDHGEVLAAGTIDELKESAGADTVITVRYESPVPAGLAARAGLRGPAGDQPRSRPTAIRSGCSAREPEGVLGEAGRGRRLGRPGRSVTPRSSGQAWRPSS